MTLAETQYTLAPDGVHIAYQVTGAGDVDLVLMHGTVSHLEIAWEDPKLRRLYDRLGEFSRLIRFDRRGMGMSDPLDAAPDVRRAARGLPDGHGRRGVDRAALMGTTDAGVLALAYAAAHADRVSAVVAFETSPRLLPSPDDDFGVEMDVLQRMAAASDVIDMDTHLSIVAPGAQGRARLPVVVPPIQPIGVERLPDRGLHRGADGWDIRDRLPRSRPRCWS